MPIVEIEAPHADWVLGGEVRQHIDPTVGRDSRVNGMSLGERKISQHVLRARGVPKQTKGASV